MSAQEPQDRSTANHVRDVIGNVVQAGRIDQVVFQAPAVAGVEAVVVPVVGTALAAPELLVGRAGQIDELLGALAVDGQASASGGQVSAAVVSVVAGMGGVGKTTLTRHVADLAVDRGWFTGGAVVVDLHGYSSDRHQVRPEQVFAPLLRALGTPADRLPTTVAEQAGAYHRLLADAARLNRRILLVLDNASTGRQVGDLLPRQRAHRVLVTTRDTLALPTGARRLVLGVLDQPDAQDLLDRALREQHPEDDRLSAGRAVAELARACGALPLALRIVAALLADDPALAVEELVAELREAPIDAFAHGELAVAAVFAASLRRLWARDPEAARLLSLLPLNPGPDVAAGAAAALADRSLPEVRVRLRVLCQAHLLQQAGGRWQAHDLIRRYTRERETPALGDDRIDAATTRLLDHYTSTADAAGAHLSALPGDPLPVGFDDRDQALAWLDAERPNLLAAAYLTAATHRHARTVELSEALLDYLQRQRHFTDRVTLAQLARAAAEHLGDPATIATARNHSGMALQDVGRFDEAIVEHRAAIDLHRKTGNRLSEGVAWNALGLALDGARRFDQAITAYERQLEICRETGDRYSAGMACVNLGKVLRRTGRLGEAVAAYRAGIELHREVGDRQLEGGAWNNLGAALLCLGRVTEAAAANRTAIDLAVQVADSHGEAMARVNLGIALLQLRRFDEAIAEYEASLRTFVDTGDREGEAKAWANMGMALAAARRLAEAHECWEKALVASTDPLMAAQIRQLAGEHPSTG